MRVPANQLRKGDIIEYSSFDLSLVDPYVPLQGEIIRIAYTPMGMQITTASGSWECSRSRFYNRVTAMPILGPESWPIGQGNLGSETFGGKSIE